MMNDFFNFLYDITKQHSMNITIPNKSPKKRKKIKVLLSKHFYRKGCFFIFLSAWTGDFFLKIILDILQQNWLCCPHWPIPEIPISLEVISINFIKCTQNTSFPCLLFNAPLVLWKTNRPQKMPSTTCWYYDSIVFYIQDLMENYLMFEWHKKNFSANGWLFWCILGQSEI